MIHTIQNATARHVDLLRKQRTNLAEMFQLALADLDAAIADAEDILGAPKEAETVGEPAIQFRQAAE